MSWCATNNVDLEKYRKDLETYATLANRSDTGQIMYLKIVYVVYPFTNEDNISDSRIRSMHSVFNTVFGSKATHTYDNTTNNYAYSSQMVSCDIKFRPTNTSLLTEGNGLIVRLPVQNAGECEAFTNVTEAKQACINAGVSFETGTLYCIITHLNPKIPTACGSGWLAGQAEAIPSATFVISPVNVGSAGSPGNSSYTDFSQGKIGAHEVGHCLGLLHQYVFTSGDRGGLTEEQGCSNADTLQTFRPECPVQLESCELANENQTSGALCNTHRDYLVRVLSDSSGTKPGVSRNYTCYTTLELGAWATGALKGESYFHIMDTSNDPLRLGFFPSDRVIMRGNIVNRTDLFTLYETDQTGSSDNGFPGWAIGVIIGVGVILLIIVIAFVMKSKSKNAKSESYKRKVIVLTPEETKAWHEGVW